MFADNRASHGHHGPAKRRGVVLILVLGMLALLALIGVTFATFASQSRISARYFVQSASIPDAGDLMDYALVQLINDTDNPMSAIRGHSLKRDMYGTDSSSNALVSRNSDGSLLLLTSASTNATTNIITCATNIPVGLVNYTGWVLKLAPTAYGFDANGNPIVVGGTNPTAQSFMVVNDDTSGTLHQFQLSPADTMSRVANIVTNAAADVSSLMQPSNALNTLPFVLDGRYRSAFNGPGVAGALRPTAARYGNYRFNRFLLADDTDTKIGKGNPNTFGLDEDYDACDLENWFLAIQSADGSIAVPSFHRPGIIANTDWDYTFSDFADATTANSAAKAMAKVLRPRSIDHGPNNPFKNGVETPVNAQTMTLDVDNDGDGKTDSVWLDLGYRARRNANGKLYKPLFAFMVIGLNGRIPLNTAGNLAGRNDNGDPLGGQTTHLGNSVSEVDPTYALQNAATIGGVIYGQQDNSTTDVRTIQLQNLLSGTRPVPPEILNGQQNPLIYDGTNQLVGTQSFGDLNYVQWGADPITGYPMYYYLPNGIVDTSDWDSAAGAIVNDPPNQSVARIASTPNPIPGRWGEAASIAGLGTAVSPFLASRFNNPTRAGFSQGNREVDDDNFNAFDPYGAGGSAHQGEVSDSDYYDSSASPILPVERMRRFVTPADIDGSGRVVRWPGSANAPNGSDNFGRVAFLSYFRPAGLPGVVNPNGSLAFATSATDGSGNPIPAMDTTNNPLHGFDFYRFPFLATAPRNSQRVGGMPTNTPLDSMTNQPTATTGTILPTYDSQVNRGLQTDGQNEADEMNLYSASPSDQPFGPSDLEWLYRSHDVDGYSLSSRLSNLAPISFTNPVDGLRRRRLFSIDTWDLTSYAWVNDNPQNNFSSNRVFSDPKANTSFGTLDSLAQSILHRGRRINLNFPFPVSNNPSETVRQKWIRETYLTLKSVLPPMAVDTAEELAQLSQFVVNIVDFRDTDGAMTRFVNTDVQVTQSSGATVSPTLTKTSGTVTKPFDPSHNTSTSPTTGDTYLVQYGMEYNPVAINEVLAYSFVYNKSTTKGSPSYDRDNRFFIELVNTLTDSAAKTSGVPAVSASRISLSGFQAPTAANDPYSSGCWDLIFTDDSPTSRPDPFTGQLINTAGNYYSPIPLTSSTFAEGVNLTLPPLPSTADPATIASMNPPALPQNYYCVIGNPPPATSTEKYEPSKTNATPISAPTGTQAPSLSRLLGTSFDPLRAPGADPAVTFPLGVLPGYSGLSSSLPTNILQRIPTTYKCISNANYPATASANQFTPSTDAPAASNKYYWVCLRRPANPFDVVSETNPMVVVDAVRFPYVDATGTILPPTGGNDPTATPDGNAAYSIKRWQPYRGGQAIPLPENNGIPDWRYGYTEQNVPYAAPGADTTYQHWGFLNSDGSQQVTRTIFHSLGQYGGSKAPGGPTTEVWSYFPFNDRDFTSVAELLLVPGCPPGLFTKRFVEFPLNTANESLFTGVVPTTYPYALTTTGPSAPVQASNTLSTPTVVTPTASPYLVDKFFYSASNTDATNPTSTVDNQTGDGWHRMLEFFEVPSQSMGAYGTVAQGANFDWFRQDLKPGLINLNLIVDEEVFFSVFGKQNSDYEQQLLDTQGAVNTTVSTDPTATDIPLVVTSVDGTTGNATSGKPTSVTQITRTSGFTDTTNLNNNSLKPAFIQFLKLRHGGSGYLFGFGTGDVGSTGSPPMERPYRSLSYPDINLTIMRPASLPPAANSMGAAPFSVGSTPVLNTSAAAGYVGDPGLRNPYRYPGRVTAAAPASRVFPPVIPARRLIQPPDDNSGGATNSNASLTGDSYANTQIQNGNLLGGGTNPPYLTSNPLDTGTAFKANLGAGATLPDNSQQPYFRTEMLQKAMNLTTVRTHQYAVWITVGFFEVVRQGNPDLVDTTPWLAYDMLGGEIGLDGKLVRYRGFYIVDRTKATGFDPVNPGDYHNCVVYGHVIQ